MAKGKYHEWITDDGLLQIQGWARNGLTNEQIAKNIGINPDTLYSWIKKFPEISDHLKKGRAPVAIEIENALIKKARGYTEAAEEIEEIREKDGVRVRQKRVVTKTYPPDTAAGIFILKNKMRGIYQDRPKSDEELESIRLDNDLKRIELERLTKNEEELNSRFMGIPASFIAPQFASLHFDIERQGHQEYILPGGRGSTKSSFISLEIINLIEQNPTFHAMIVRLVANTMKTSVYNQMIWAIDKLGLNDQYHATKSPLEITKLSTGQKIYFRGADDPLKLKSTKVPFGHLAILWYEELDQFKGEEGVRKIEQSVIRGGDEAFIFKSYNPPRSKSNWANEYTNQARIDNPLALVTDSCYTGVPKEWLGQPFFDRADYLKQKNPSAFENEYLGVANGSGGNIFENLQVRTISNEEINSFDRVANGIDWGWYPDPFHFIRVHYDTARERLYVFDEFRAYKTRNSETAKEVKKHLGENEVVVCDTEKKSIADFRDYGINAHPAKKGAGSRDYGYKWLQSLNEIIVDPKRTPYAYRELLEYEYERDKDGQIIPGYPDENDHALDAIRYACERFMKRGKTPGFKAL